MKYDCKKKPLYMTPLEFPGYIQTSKKLAGLFFSHSVKYTGPTIALLVDAFDKVHSAVVHYAYTYIYCYA